MREKKRPVPPVLRVAQGQIANDLKMKCTSPMTVTLGTEEDVYGRVLLIIDEFIFRAMINKPAVFQCTSTNNDPSLGFQTLRGYWLYAFQYYMWRCRCINGNYVSANSYDNLTVPVGLAKIFQQFAPYVDPNTGSKMRYVLNPLNLSIVTDNQNVDSSYASLDGCLGQPKLRYMIHPAVTTGTATLVEYATAGTRSFAAAGTNIISFDSYFGNFLTNGPLSIIQTLFPGNICIEDIPKFAPDASAYAWFTKTAVVCNSPCFRSDMAVITGRGFQDGSIDSVNNYPYDKPLPTCRAVDNTGSEFDTDSAGYYQTLTQVYAYLTGYSVKWAAGSAVDLMNSTKCFTDVKEFSYRSFSIDLSKFARKLFNVFKSDAWLVTNGAQELVNTQFTFSSMAWTSLLSRLFESASVNCTGNLGTNTSFWVIDAKVDNQKMPAVLTKMISSVGPVRVGGKVNFPYLGVAFSGINTPTGSNVGWYNAITATATWNPSSVPYGFGPGVSPVGGPLSVTYPNSNNPFSRTDPQVVVYSSILVKTYSTFVTAYQNTFPNTFIMDSTPSVVNEKCGTLSGTLSNVNHTLSTGSTTWTCSNMSATGALGILSISSAYCNNKKDVLNTANYSLVANRTGDLGIVLMRTLPNGTNVDIETALQQTQNQAGNSTFSAMKKAQEYVRSDKSNTKKGNKTGRDITYSVTSKALENASNDTQDRQFENGTGDRTELIEQLKDLTKSAVIHATKEYLNLDPLTFGAQSEIGEPTFQTRMLETVTSALGKTPMTMALTTGHDAGSELLNAFLDYFGDN